MTEIQVLDITAVPFFNDPAHTIHYHHVRHNMVSGSYRNCTGGRIWPYDQAYPAAAAHRRNSTVTAFIDLELELPL